MSNHEIVSDRNEDLRITLQAVPRNVNCFVMALSGNINTHNTSYLHDEIAKLINAGYTQLLFHCGGAGECLVGWHRLFRRSVQGSEDKGQGYGAG